MGSARLDIFSVRGKRASPDIGGGGVFGTLRAFSFSTANISSPGSNAGREGGGGGTGKFFRLVG